MEEFNNNHSEKCWQVLPENMDSIEINVYKCELEIDLMRRLMKNYF